MDISGKACTDRYEVELAAKDVLRHCRPLREIGIRGGLNENAAQVN
jgi:hypothetical protein